MVFTVHCYINFQVYIYNLSHQLSSQLLRRNHAFYFAFCCIAPSMLLATLKYTHTYTRHPLPPNTHMWWDWIGAGWWCLQTCGDCLWQRIISYKHFEDRGLSVSPASGMKPSTEWVPVIGKYRGLLDW